MAMVQPKRLPRYQRYIVELKTDVGPSWVRKHPRLDVARALALALVVGDVELTSIQRVAWWVD